MHSISFWAFAAIVVTSALGFITPGSSSSDVDVADGRDLALALANQLVDRITLKSSITLAEDDWRDLGELPILLQRNVTIAGSQELVSSGDLPVFNGSFVKNKVRLLGGFMLNITGVVLTWYREDMPSSTPGIDLLANSLNTTGPPPLFVLHKSAFNNRLCFPVFWSAKSIQATVRPTYFAGVNKATSDLPQPNCRDELTGPWLTRCYPARRMYVDIAAYGAASGPTGSYERTGYLVHAIETDLLCSGVMSEDCITKYGAVGCFYLVFPKTKGASSTSAASPPPNSTPSPNTTPLQGPSQHRRVLVVVLCSVFGGVAGIMAAVVVVLWSRRLRRLQSLPAAAATGHVRFWQGRKKVREKHGGDGPCESCGTNSDCTGEQPQQPNIRLDVMASTAGGQLVVRSELLPPPAQEQQLVADPSVPITHMTLPRHDMHLLADPFITAEDNGVELLPNATRGAGSFGRVVEGVYKGQRVAVKLVADAYQWGGPSETLLRSFAQEVEVLCRCQHPNVVRLLAACLTPPRVCLVMELMETSLEQLMYPQPRTATRNLLPLTTVLHLGLEISKGLEYLHPTIIHRDLKPGNVLLNDPTNARPIVKLADFGLSRLRSTEAPTQTPDAGTPAYLAPEGLDPMNYVITHKADMYSLAILMWEMVVGERPWLGHNMMEVAVKVTLQGCRPSLERVSDARCPPKLRSLIECCWDSDPRRRPAAAEVTKNLALILQEVESGGAGGGRVAAGEALQRGPDYHDGGDGGSDGGGRRGARVLGQQVDSALAAALADAKDRMSPETCSIGDARAPGSALADPGSGGGGTGPQRPPAPEVRALGFQPKGIAVALRGLLHGLDAGVDAARAPAPPGPRVDPLAISQLHGSAAYPYTQRGWSGARTIGFLSSGALSDACKGTAGAGSLQGGPDAPPPPAAAAAAIGPSGDTSLQLHVDGAAKHPVPHTGTTMTLDHLASVPTDTR